MSDTPETDAKTHSIFGSHSCATVLADFARKLERERDEARDELRDIRLNLGADAEGYTLVHAVCGIQNERDEARELHRNALREREATEKEVEAMLERAQKTEGERDEAREQIKELTYIGGRAIALADIDLENDKFGVVSELRSDLEKIKEGAK